MPLQVLEVAVTQSRLFGISSGESLPPSHGEHSGVRTLKPRGISHGAVASVRTRIEEGSSLLSFRTRKAISLLRRPFFVKILRRHRVAAATEHLEAIRFASANTLIDAGANKGQFSAAFRFVRPNARIFAFEPLTEAADVYDSIFGADPLTSLRRVALGRAQGTAEFHIANRADSSSLLKLGTGQQLAFDVKQATTANVRVERLDQCVDIPTQSRPILLKVDVQGAELEVFGGCGNLEAIDLIYVELSFVELYEGQPLFDEVHQYLASRGFTLAGVYNQVSTEHFGPTQIDVLYRRSRGDHAATT